MHNWLRSQGRHFWIILIIIALAELYIGGYLLFNA